MSHIDQNLSEWVINTKKDYNRVLRDLSQFLRNLSNRPSKEKSNLISSALRDIFPTTIDSTKMKDKFGKLGKVSTSKTFSRKIYDFCWNFTAKLIEQNLTNKKEESRRAIIAGLTLHHVLWAHTSLMIKYAMMKYAKNTEPVSPQGKWYFSLFKNSTENFNEKSTILKLVMVRGAKLNPGKP